jgi:hypothetical protein
MNKFVVAIKVNGKILRENGDFVYLPFGTEYSILLKNLDTRKAEVKITIDGQDVLDGHSLIIDGNRSTELEGFLKGSVAENKFKFIEKTQEISEYRGDRIDDGIIRVEYTFEKVVIHQPIIKTMTFPHTGNPNWHDTYYTSSGTWNAESESLTRGMNIPVAKGIPSTDEMKPANLDGITVKGSEIKQQFQYGYIGELEKTSSVIILNLKGKKEDDTPIAQAVTVDAKVTCSTCGQKMKFNINMKFCSRCGSYITLENVLDSLAKDWKQLSEQDKETLSKELSGMRRKEKFKKLIEE